MEKEIFWKKCVLLIAAFLMASTAAPLPAAFVYDDHGSCCFRREQMSRYAWLGGALLAGAGAGAAAGYAAGKDRGKRGDDGPMGLPGPCYAADQTNSLTIFCRCHLSPESNVLIYWWVVDPTGAILNGGEIQNTSSPGERRPLFHLAETMPKMCGIYKICFTVKEAPDDFVFEGPCIDDLVLSIGSEETTMTPDISPSDWGKGKTCSFYASFYPPPPKKEEPQENKTP